MKKMILILSFSILLFGGAGFITYEDAIDQIAQKIDAYFEKFPTEKLYIHFAEDVWIAGQTVWCKGYLVKGKDFLPATESKVVYLEVVNSQGIIVQKLNLNASNGLARGSFILPDSLTTGWYQVNAYTQWMLNFEASTHFTRPVLLVNPLQENPQNMPSPFFTAEDQKVIILPQKQVLMEIEKAGTSAMRVKIRSVDENFTAKNLYLLAVSGEKVVYTEIVELHANEVETELPFNLFPLGIVQLALFDEKTALLDAQEIVIPPLSAPTVQIQPDKTTYVPREKAELRLSLTNIQGKPLKAFASVTIRKKDALSDQLPEVNIDQFLHLGGETMEKRAFDLQKDETSQSQPIRVIPSSGFSWVKVVNQPLPVQQFTKEDEGITIKGKLLTPEGKPIADKRVVLSVTGKDLWFQYDYTQEDGSFNLLIERVFGEKEVVIQALELKEEYQIVLNEEKNDLQRSLQPLRSGVEPQVLEGFIQKYRQREKIYNTYAFYQQDKIGDQSDKKRRNAPFRFYGVPNVELYLEDFIDLPNMEEICRELLPGVQLKVSDNQYDFNVFDVRTRTFLPDEPKLFVDGVLVYDKVQVANLPPENIEKIETVNRRTFYGDFRFDGVISIFTKAGNIYESMLPPEALKTKLFFYNQPDRFPIIQYEEEEKRTPDLRSLIYWNPDVKFDEEGKLTLAYIHSDETGTFEIILEGITTDGIPFSHCVNYEVVFQ